LSGARCVIAPAALRIDLLAGLLVNGAREVTKGNSCVL
jgi:hypothetical protein